MFGMLIVVTSRPLNANVVRLAIDACDFAPLTDCYDLLLSVSFHERSFQYASNTFFPILLKYIFTFLVYFSK